MKKKIYFKIFYKFCDYLLLLGFIFIHLYLNRKYYNSMYFVRSYIRNIF